MHKRFTKTEALDHMYLALRDAWASGYLFKSQGAGSQAVQDSANSLDNQTDIITGIIGDLYDSSDD